MNFFKKLFNYHQFEINSLEYENSLILITSFILCYFIAILNFIYFKYIHIIEDFSIVENSILWFLFGTIFVLYYFAKLSNKLKKSLTIITTIVITIYFVITYYPIVGPTVWTYSFIILLISLIRNENSNLIILSVTLFFLGIYIWEYSIYYILNDYYYVSQFIAFSIMFVISAIIMINNRNKNNKISNQFKKLNSTNDILEETNSTLDKAIKDQQKTNLLLEESEKKFKSIVSALPDVIFKIDKEGKFIECEGNDTSWLLYSAKEIIGNNTTNLLAKNVAELALESIRIVSETKILQRIEYQLVEESTENYYEARFIAADDNSCYCIIRDISEEKRNQKIIEYLSFHDQLTELNNRRFFEEEILRLDNPEYYPLSIIMIDVNGLKIINDAFGHLAGDKLLITVANILLRECELDNNISRIGGDEFIVLLPKTTIHQTEELSERIYNAISKEKVYDVDISVSLGWGIKFTSDQGINDIFKKAEEMMYHNKLIKNQSLKHNYIKHILETLNDKNEREKIHSERVSEISKLIGEEMGLDCLTMKEIVIAGLVHDIGKISISNNILNKEDKLTDLEYEIIKRHPESGYHLLKSVNEYFNIAEYVLCHHERWDGKGYPRGLKGEEIPLVSRILAIADAYEDMVTNRPYRVTLSKEAALEKMKDNVGTQFDENIVKIFVEKVYKKI